MKITFAALSKTGRRTNNEDAFKIIDTPSKNRWTAIVCDGMGGHALGEVASETVANALARYWEQEAHRPDCAEKVAEACERASDALEARADSLKRCQMGTTMVMASLEGDMLTVAHTGDSRCYLVRPARNGHPAGADAEGVVYETKDHVRLDYGWEVVERCFFSRRRAAAQPETARFRVLPGDRILLCSDGVYKSMPPCILKERLADEKSPEEILDVIDFLCERNGDDNYTAILAEITEA